MKPEIGIDAWAADLERRAYPVEHPRAHCPECLGKSRSGELYPYCSVECMTAAEVREP